MLLIICYYYYYLFSWFLPKLKLVGNTTILPGRSQLVYLYGRNPFISSIFIDIALVSDTFVTLTLYVLF